MKNFIYFIIMSLLSTNCITTLKNLEKKKQEGNVKKVVIRDAKQKAEILDELSSISNELHISKNFSDNEDIKFIADKINELVNRYKKLKEKILKLELHLLDVSEKEQALAKDQNKLSNGITIVTGKAITSVIKSTEHNEQNDQKNEKDILVKVDKITNDPELTQVNIKKQNKMDAKKSDKMTLYQEGKDLFTKEAYKKSIEAFEEYRKKNAYGEEHKTATLYIAKAFQKLKLFTESHIFLNEVITLYPKSQEAKEAKILLKKLK